MIYLIFVRALTLYISMEEFQKKMEGVWSTSVSVETLNEAPQDYKDAFKIINFLSQVLRSYLS